MGIYSKDEIQCRGQGPDPLSHSCRSPRAKRLVSYERLTQLKRYSMARFYNFLPEVHFAAKIQESYKMVAFGHFLSDLDGFGSILRQGNKMFWQIEDIIEIADFIGKNRQKSENRQEKIIFLFFFLNSAILKLNSN